MVAFPPGVVGCGDTALNGPATADASSDSDADDSNPPVVTLLAPAAGQVFRFGHSTSIAVAAHVSDDRDAPTALDLTLMSSVNGQVAKPTANAAGEVNFELSTLSPGQHTLELTAVDRGGRRGWAEVSISVER